MDVKGEVGKQEFRLVDNMPVFCERRHVTKAGNVGYKIKKAVDKGYSNNEWTIFAEIKT